CFLSHIYCHTFVLLSVLHSRSTLFPYTTLFRSGRGSPAGKAGGGKPEGDRRQPYPKWICRSGFSYDHRPSALKNVWLFAGKQPRSEEHTSELRHVSISYAVFCLKKINTQIISQV